MELFKKKVDLYWLILSVNTILIVVMVIWYFNITNPKIEDILCGAFVSLFFANVQLMLTWSEHKKIVELETIGVKKVLPYRDDELFYKRLISESKKSIDVLGSTAYRFLKDFGNEDRPDKQDLLHALTRKVRVRILLPKKDTLFSSEDKHKSEMSAEILQKLRCKHQLLDYKYYDHLPTHSLVVVDNHCLVGPIFPNVSSKDSPAIYTDASSPFVTPYLEYFEHEWKHAKEQ